VEIALPVATSSGTSVKDARDRDSEMWSRSGLRNFQSVQHIKPEEALLQLKV